MRDDPERCADCGQQGRVIKSERADGYRRRRHECALCQQRWTTWQSREKPAPGYVQELMAPGRPVAARAEPTVDRGGVSEEAGRGAAVTLRPRRRVARSSYLGTGKVT